MEKHEPGSDEYGARILTLIGLGAAACAAAIAALTAGGVTAAKMLKKHDQHS